MKAKVSAVIITYNEALNLSRTLSQLYWCDEIIVVDSYSTDETLDICNRYGCKVFSHPFSGYGEQKRYAIDQAAHEWILSLDADEYLTKELVDELQEELEDTGVYRGYLIPMNLVFRGYEFKYGKENRRYFLRLFNRNWGCMSNTKVHEHIEVKGPVKNLKNNILHYSYLDIDQYIYKINKYSTLGAAVNIEKCKVKNQALIYLSIPFYFIKYYFVERNFLNGKNGFYWSVLSSFYHFVKYIKMQDLKQIRSNREDKKNMMSVPKN